MTTATDAELVSRCQVHNDRSVGYLWHDMTGRITTWARPSPSPWPTRYLLTTCPRLSCLSASCPPHLWCQPWGLLAAVVTDARATPRGVTSGSGAPKREASDVGRTPAGYRSAECWHWRVCVWRDERVAASYLAHPGSSLPTVPPEPAGGQWREVQGHQPDLGKEGWWCSLAVTSFNGLLAMTSWVFHIREDRRQAPCPRLAPRDCSHD